MPRPKKPVTRTWAAAPYFNPAPPHPGPGGHIAQYNLDPPDLPTGIRTPFFNSVPDRPDFGRRAAACNSNPPLQRPGGRAPWDHEEHHIANVPQFGYQTPLLSQQQQAFEDQARGYYSFWPFDLIPPEPLIPWNGVTHFGGTGYVDPRVLHSISPDDWHGLNVPPDQYAGNVSNTVGATPANPVLIDVTQTVPQPANQPANAVSQSANQPANPAIQPIAQPINIANQASNQPANLVNQSVHQSVNHANQPANQPVNQTTNQLVGQTMKETSAQATAQSSNQSFNTSMLPSARRLRNKSSAKTKVKKSCLRCGNKRSRQQSEDEVNQDNHDSDDGDYNAPARPPKRKVTFEPATMMYSAAADTVKSRKRGCQRPQSYNESDNLDEASDSDFNPPAQSRKRRKAAAIHDSKPSKTSKTIKRKADDWTTEHENFVHGLMIKLLSEKRHGYKTEAKWQMIADDLLSDYGVDRSKDSIKNHWGRVLRARFGLEERNRPKNASLVTGVESPEQRSARRKAIKAGKQNGRPGPRGEKGKEIQIAKSEGGKGRVSPRAKLEAEVIDEEQEKEEDEGGKGKEHEAGRERAPSEDGPVVKKEPGMEEQEEADDDPTVLDKERGFEDDKYMMSGAIGAVRSSDSE